VVVEINLLCLSVESVVLLVKSNDLTSCNEEVSGNHCNKSCVELVTLENAEIKWKVWTAGVTWVYLST